MTDITDLRTQLTILARDQHRDRYLRSYSLRNPAADPGPGTQPYLQASAHADACVPLYSDARLIADATNIRTARGVWLQAQLLAAGLPGQLPATGAIGYAEVSASSGGGNIFAGDEIREPVSGLRFKVLTTALYANGALVPIQGIDTGTATNLPAGTVLQWTSPRPGIGPTAKVFAQSDGSGLTGGRPVESDEEGQDRLIAARQHPPATGNDAEYQKVIRESPGIAVQAPFTWPCAKGSATMGFAFLMRPAKPGASRAPNGAAIAQVLANLVATESADDQIFAHVVVEVPVGVVLRVTWSRRAPSWVDSAPWPAYSATPAIVNAGIAPTATNFRLTSGSTLVNPVAGQTIAFFDRANTAFVRKRIASVSVHTAGTSWDITCATTNGVSDLVYVPQVGQAASPWSDSLQTLVAPVVGYFDGFGPGEIFSSLPDRGLRGRRQPEPGDAYTSIVDDRITAPLFSLTSVQSVELAAPAPPHATPVGTPGTSVNLTTLGDLAAFP